VADKLVDRGRLARELREWLTEVSEEGRKIAKVVIAHEGSAHPVRVYPQLPDKGEGPAADAFIAKVAERMESDARNWSGKPQKYWVEGWRGEDEFYTSRIGFEVAIEDPEEGSGHGPTEKPTEQGITQMLMRLLDSSHGKSLAHLGRHSEAFILLLMQELGEKRKEIQRLTDERATMIQAFEAMATEKTKRDLLEAEAKRNGEMVEELFKDVKAALPILANRFAGEKLFPEPELAPEQVILRQLVRDLEGPEMQALLHAIAQKSPRTGIMISELALKVKGEDERRDGVTKALKEGKQEIARGLMNGSATHDRLLGDGSLQR
jgi:hypothetical protein